jgi:CBS domain-containing protein
MQLSEIMTRNVECTSPDASLQEAADQMRARSVGALPVCYGERIVGMLTDRNIVVRATAAGRDPRTTRVREVMTPHVLHCFDYQSVHEAAALMEEHKIRRLPILSRQEQLVGIVTLDDLAARGGYHRLTGEVLQEVAEQSAHER